MIRYAARTRAGNGHAENEDRVGVDPGNGVFLVVDGVGALADAAATAQAVVEQLPRRVRRGVPTPLEPGAADAVAGVVAALNEQVRSAARTGPGTTGAAVALLLVRDDRALVAHLGDSRVYLARDGRLRRLTEDHRRDGQLTRFVGMAGDPTPGVSVHPLRAGDRMLLCTDGLTGCVDDRTLARLVAGGGEAAGVCSALVAAAVDVGAIDDLSVVTVDYGVGGGADAVAGQR